MLSLTSQYALRAIIYLTRHADDWPIPGRQVARDTQIPAKYLSKILGDLVRSGVLESSPGKSGGFRLRRSPKATYLQEVLEPFEQLDQRRCPFGNQECTDSNPCRAHSRWKRVVEAEQRFFKRTSVYDVAVHVPAKKGTAGRKRA
ncbi:MAG: Rrf2 family transcriptional regulator [Planctomycetes bacterium]|nr:Rrf2 family transcriptional regulator [Planctomycetota bacterium]